MTLIINDRFFESHSKMKAITQYETDGYWYSKSRIKLYGHSFQLKGNFDDIKNHITVGSSIIYDNGIVNSVKVAKILSISRLSKLSDGDIIKVSYIYDKQLISSTDLLKHKRMLSVKSILC
jgi:hypothetical protein